MSKKIRVAFIKYAGLSAGGTEKFLQVIAANLPKDRFDVDYYYSDAAPYLGSNYRSKGTDSNRKAYMISKKVSLIEFNITSIDVRHRKHKWIKTNFWKLFKESNYDIVQTGRAGPSEYPFYKLKNIPIVDSLHLIAGVDNQFNISRVMHISDWSANKWISMGGDVNRVVQVSMPMEITEKENTSFRKEFNLESKFIFGFHQRDDNYIFSDIPLNAYKKIEDDNTAFILMGGGDLYREQALKLGLKNIYFIPFTAKPELIYRFLRTLNVYSHGRKDGEVNSTAMAEAMFFGLPIVSHVSDINNGHIDSIANAGLVVKNIEDYIAELKKLKDNKVYYKEKLTISKNRFDEHYSLNRQIKKIEYIYEDVVRNPFQGRTRNIFNYIKSEWKYFFYRLRRKLYKKYTKK
jgi:glycosyltransferase involved in cell wall biosynthesis